MLPKISIFIIAKDEAGIIERTLKQASELASELVFVDSGSSDGTWEVAQKYADKLVHQDWLGYGPQKNFALSLCTNDWVLSLDADEVLTDELIREISSLDFKADGYQIPRKLFIQDRFIRYGGYYPDYQLRLFRKSHGRFCESQVHESVEMLSETGLYSKSRKDCPKLKFALNHYAYDSVEEFRESYLKYAGLASCSKSQILALLSALYVFVYKFIFRLGFLEGLLGLHLAAINAEYQLRKKFK